MKNLKKILYLLNIHEKKKACVLMLLILVMAFLDILGVASILPFMTVLANPNVIETNILFNKFFIFTSNYGVDNSREFLFVLGLIVFIFLFLSLTFKSFMDYLQIRFVTTCEHSIGKRLIEGYLHQPYSWFLNRHSSDLGKNILSEVHLVIFKAINPMITLIAHSVIALTLIILLFFTDPKLAIIVSFTLAILYGLIYKFSQGLLGRIGKKQLEANQSRFFAVNEAFSAIKELKVSGVERIYIDRFSLPSENRSKYMAISHAIGNLPRYAVEMIAFGGIILVTLYFMSISNSLESVIPILALYTFAGYRLMPSLQQIYLAFTDLRFIGPALDSLHKEFRNLATLFSQEVHEKMNLEKEINIDQIYFEYPQSKISSLKNISMKISVGSVVGLIGPTGSGKTTLGDIILGLFQPQRGTIKIDGKIINKENIRIWQNSIGYVPQEIYLSDDTIASNIAFGSKNKNIDMESVKRAAKIANIHNFIMNDLPERYETRVGERGVRLSGGQRQRIGIARALYFNPKVILLDEATSALDNLTEREVMDAINKVSRNTTIIIIAHRLTTLSNCDVIYLLDKGEIKKKGKFDEIISDKDQTFQLNKKH